MKSLIVLLIFCGALLMGADAALAKDVKTPIYKIDAQGIGEKIGYVVLSDSPEGLTLEVDVTGLTPGTHGMHVHEAGDCGPAVINGKAVPGGAAKGHYDPEKTNRHMGPMGMGHKGDLPALQADALGRAKTTLKAPHLKLADVDNRAIVIHAGGDNYSDMPNPLGGGGRRVACGVIPSGV